MDGNFNEAEIFTHQLTIRSSKEIEDRKRYAECATALARKGKRYATDPLEPAGHSIRESFGTRACV